MSAASEYIGTKRAEEYAGKLLREFQRASKQYGLDDRRTQEAWESYRRAAEAAHR